MHFQDKENMAVDSKKYKETSKYVFQLFLQDMDLTTAVILGVNVCPSPIDDMPVYESAAHGPLQRELSSSLSGQGIGTSCESTHADCKSLWSLLPTDQSFI